MRQMGEKPVPASKCRPLASRRCHGDNGIDGRGFPTVETALVAAEKIGFPVMLKAAAGGGGRGMAVRKRRQVPAAFESAKREAKAAFGDDTVYLEKQSSDPATSEIQVFGDRHGNHVYLFERDCSVQRRNQKVIESHPARFSMRICAAEWVKSRPALLRLSITSEPAPASFCCPRIGTSTFWK